MRYIDGKPNAKPDRDFQSTFSMGLNRTHLVSRGLDMAIACIAKLIKDNESQLLRERRSADRKPFACPVTITAGRNRENVHDAFSRDISPIGLGLVSRVDWQSGTRAKLRIQGPGNQPTIVSAEARWSQPFGNQWYVSGWIFLN